MPTNKSKLDRTHKPDSLDRKIMNAIRQDRRRWVPDEIAATIQEPAGTVEKRVKRLRQEGRVQDITTVDLSAAGFPLRYRIDIKINPRELRDNLGGHPNLGKTHTVTSQKGLARYIMNVLPQVERFKNRVIVEDVTIVLGDPADLCAVVHVKNYHDVFLFVTEGLRTLGGVDSTSTSQEAWSVLTGDVSDHTEDEEEDDEETLPSSSAGVAEPPE